MSVSSYYANLRKSTIDYIKTNIDNGKTLLAIAAELNMTKANVSRIVCTYLPEYRKENRPIDKKIPRTVQSDLIRTQHLRFCRKRQNARHTGYEWNLKFEDITWPTHCPILGLELDYFADSRQENSVSFDRLDSTKGYCKGNVVIVSWRANRIKNDGTLEEHKKIVQYLEKNT